MSTNFIGREKELQDLHGLLLDEGCRLVTIFGVGGVGKTRLAREITGHIREYFSDGTHIVELEVLTSPMEMLTKIGETLNLVFHEADNVIDELMKFLRDRQLLLLLDNVEQIPSDELDPVITQLIDIAQNCKLLVTSRRRLNLKSETTYPLYGLNYRADRKKADSVI